MPGTEFNGVAVTRTSFGSRNAMDAHAGFRHRRGGLASRRTLLRKARTSPGERDSSARKLGRGDGKRRFRSPHAPSPCIQLIETILQIVRLTVQMGTW